MRLVMMGTGPFAVPTFRGLFATHHDVAALITAPVRVVRGKRVDALNPMRDVAHEHQLPILQPESINAPQTQQELRGLAADLYVVCDYGQILSAETLATARLGGINLHASLLPKYRGAAPINWAIYYGEVETGATVIHMTPKVDAGPCVAQASTKIEPNETAVELETRLAEMGAWLVRRAIDALEAGRLEVIPQNAALASKAPRLKKTDGAIDWRRPAAAIRDQIRALEPWPKTYTFWHRGGGAPVRLIPGLAEVCAAPDTAAEPGTVLEADEGRLMLATGEGALSFASIQPAGKRMLDIDEFLRGYHVRPGERLGPDESEAEAAR